MGTQNIDTRTMAIVAAAVLCAFLPFETSHLLFMVVGALGCILVEMLGSVRSPCKEIKASRAKDQIPWRRAVPQTGYRPPADLPWRSRPQPQRFGDKGDRSLFERRVAIHPAEVSAHQEITPKLEVSPPAAPTFKCIGGWDAEVRELLSGLAPSPNCKKCAAELAVLARRLLPEILPDVYITAIVTGNLSGASGRAYGVAVPDMSLCLQIRREALPSISRRLKDRSAARFSYASPETDVSQDIVKSQKLALRSCLQRFTVAGMKFKRTAFVGTEPKTTFVIPTSFNLYSEVVPVDLYVNACTPQRYGCLLDACRMYDPRASELIHLVKRWAKDRAVCMSPKGHLPVYGWAMLTIYYLQNGVRNPLLPSFSGLAPSMHSEQVAELLVAARCGRQFSDGESTASLFKGFFRFFAEEFNWCQAISISCAPDLALKLHSNVGTGPVIVVKDPFDEASNVATGVTSDGFARLREELLRASTICASAGTSSSSALSTLLEPWAPPELAAAVAIDDDAQM